MDMVDYLNELREGILEGYTGIIQGLSAESENGKVSLPILYPLQSVSLEGIKRLCASFQTDSSASGWVFRVAGMLLS